ncbi:hypothetical protein B0T17DRAFT_613259 [Bombardia bombarda]|uniref:Uncharacterized protein n=1 Tax=Bombardia bombarda TaxID=252184 RepID=A0AA39XM26_9PEZI|nr:hypothetical protein B0T17DRAFT_613259 [Bombardia bombarda]
MFESSYLPNHHRLDFDKTQRAPVADSHQVYQPQLKEVVFALRQLATVRPGDWIDLASSMLKHTGELKDMIEQERQDCSNSLPASQFVAEFRAERGQILKSTKDPDTACKDKPDRISLRAVQDRWKKQHIWWEPWQKGSVADMRWKHELPFEYFFKSDIDLTNDMELARIWTDRDASRPSHRFVNEMSMECEAVLG